MISIATIAEILSIDDDDISESIYNWGKSQFFIVTGLKEAAESKTYRQFIGTATSWVKLPYTNIESIDSLKLDNEETLDATVTLSNFTTALRFNPTTGLVSYESGFPEGQFLEITVTLAAYTPLEIHDYLVGLFVLKALSLFSPEKVGQIKRVKIGRYQTDFGATEASLKLFILAVDKEIESVIDKMRDDDGGLKFGAIV